MKFTSHWKFENTWLTFSVIAYLILPWIVAAATVPDLWAVYSDAGMNACVLTAIFGFGWGLAVVLNGIGVAMVGLSLASAILMGSSIALGSILALIAQDARQVLTGPGLTITALGLLMLAGVMLCARAGQLRDRDVAKSEVEGRRTSRGILICFAAGILSTLFNVALAYGGAISQAATKHGASTFSSANAIWGLAVSVGSLPSIVLCVFYLSRNGTWRLFRSDSKRSFLLCVLMAGLWISGAVTYGAMSNELGKFGPALGWPIYMSAIILSSNICGLLTGEWRGAVGAPVRYMLSGVGLQLVAILALSNVH